MAPVSARAVDAGTPPQHDDTVMRAFVDGDPSGKLPITFSRTLGQGPSYYADLETRRPFNSAKPPVREPVGRYAE